MALALNPLAVQHPDLLRELIKVGHERAGGLTELAARLGRDKSNVNRTLKALAADGLVNLGDRTLTDAGADQLAAILRAEGEAPPSVQAAPDLLPDERLVRHDQMRPDPDNPRRDVESDDFAERLDGLRESILLRGLLQNLVCRPDPEGLADYVVTGGNRRWLAIQQSIFDGDWPEDRLIRIKVEDAPVGQDPAQAAREALITALVENKQREDMPAIDEAEAFGRLVHTHGMTTRDIVEATGLTLRVVQKRLKLLELSEDDRARMRLPDHHPDHLGYKAASALLTTPRESGHGESGSPEPGLSGTAPGQVFADEVQADDPPGLDETLSDREALILVELADKAERDPDPDLGSEHYTRVQSTAVQGMVQALITRGLVGARQSGMVVLLKPRLFGTGLREWLTDLGFYGDHRADVLFEARARVHGADVARTLADQAAFATGWLNPAGPAPELPDGTASTASGVGAAWARQLTEQVSPPAREEAGRAPPPEPDQPELIEATAEEKEARRAAERERAAFARTAVALADLADEAQRWAVEARRDERGRAIDLDPAIVNPALGGEDLAGLLVGAVACGRLAQAAVYLAVMRHRFGAMGAPQVLRRLPIPVLAEAMLSARVPVREPLAEPEDAQEAEERRIDDYVEAELDDADALVDPAEAEAIAAAAPRDQEITTGLPAVPIRQSITPDFIVCLEDGRRFKSLKRHLRTRYDLSPDEYRAKWGLPADYPMVAPNYAKARADLARQMGMKV